MPTKQAEGFDSQPGDCLKAIYESGRGFVIQRAECTEYYQFLCMDTDPCGSKRRKRNVQKQNQVNQHDTESLDLVFNPARQVKYLQDMEAQRQEAREMYENMDLKKGYQGIFEMLWYSQMPCFDVKEVTSSRNNEHGMF